MRHPLWLLASAFLLTAGAVRAQDQLPEGAEIQARGPVHEAFAQPLDNDRPESNPVIEKQPPDPIEELPPDQKPEGDNVMWVPGYWQWDEDRSDFLWVSGVWRVVPPERKWVPGHWRRGDDGHQWVNGYWTSTGVTEQEYLPPPPERVETAAPEPAPGDDYFYVPGCWVYRETRYVWRTGYWLQHRPGWVWQPACYYWSPAGHVYCDGYWDYPFERRGCLFAPVYFANRNFHRDWYWTPRHCVSPSFLTVALFVRPSYRHYYFGDYDGHRYAKGGYTPWIDYRVGRGGYDPLYSYYRTAHRDRSWEKDVRNVYVARREGKIDAPPRTLNQQERVLHNLGVRKNGDAAVLRNATALGSLADVAKQSEVKLASVGREERDHHVKQATQSRTASRERTKGEQELIQRKEAPLTPKAQPKSVKLPSLPSIAAKTPSDVKVPARPDREPPVATPQDRPKPPPTDRPKPPEDRPKPPEDKPKPPPTDRPKPPEDKPKPPEDKPKPPPQDRPKPPEDKPKPPPSDKPKPPEDKPKPPPQDKPKPPEDKPKPPPQDKPKPPEDKPKPPPQDRVKPPEDKPKPPPPTERPKPPEDKPKPPPQDRPKPPPPTERPKPPDEKPRVPPPPPVKDPPREAPRERPRVDPPQVKAPPPAPKPEVKPLPPPREVPRERPRVEPPREKAPPPAPRLQAPVQAKPAPRVAPQPKAPQPKAQPSKPQGKPDRPRGR